MTRHPLDLFSLFSGMTLVAIALVGLFGLPTGVATWLWPAILIGLGLLVLGLTVARSVRPADAAVDPTDDDPERDAVLAAARAEVSEADHTTD